jgi:hypothetical protein
MVTIEMHAPPWEIDRLGFEDHFAEGDGHLGQPWGQGRKIIRMKGCEEEVQEFHFEVRRILKAESITCDHSDVETKIDH